MSSGKPKKMSWKAEALRILQNGPAGPEDYPIAAELIRKGFAEGNSLPNFSKPGTFANFRWSGLTLEGRAYAEKLQGQIKRESWSGRLLIAVSTLVGATAMWFWQEILNWLKQLVLGA